IFVHVLNPFGMAWLRRVNEENVDLNRNFLAVDERYAGADPGYRLLDTFLNGPGGADFFWLPLLLNLARHGFTSLKKSIVQGQYDFPAGLFFGGQNLQDGPAQYKAWLKNAVGSPNSVVAVDVHTGLGRYGEEVLFCHTNAEVPDLGKKITS